MTSRLLLLFLVTAMVLAPSAAGAARGAVAAGDPAPQARTPSDSAKPADASRKEAKATARGAKPSDTQRRAGADAEAERRAPLPIGPGRPALVEADAKGVELFVLSLPVQRRLGGFAITATFDAHEFLVTRPEATPALTGYMCQDNVTTPGLLRYSCVGLPQEDKQGQLAILRVHWRSRAPLPADFTFGKQDVVDDLGRTLEGVQLVLSPAPRE